MELSIVVPVYNNEKYIKRCIESILNQNFTDYEIIIVNDGSIDNSGEICNKYAEDHKNIKVIHTENRGVSNARNVGLMNAKGNYIGFIDSDDEIDENMYSILLENIVTYKSDISICSYNLHYNNNVEKKLFPFKCNLIKMQKEEIIKKFIPKIISQYGVNGKKQEVIIGSVCRCVFNRQLLIDKNIYFDNEISYTEDMIFLMQCLLESKSIILDNRALYNYYKNEGANTTQNYIKNLYDSINLSQIKLRQMLEEANCSQELVKTLSFREITGFYEEIVNICKPKTPYTIKEKVEYINKIEKQYNINHIVDKFEESELFFVKNIFKKTFKKNRYVPILIFYTLRFKFKN